MPRQLSNRETALKVYADRLIEIEEERLALAEDQKVLKGSIKGFGAPVSPIMALAKVEQNVAKRDKASDKAQKVKEAAAYLGVSAYCGLFNGEEDNLGIPEVTRKAVKKAVEQILSLELEREELKDEAAVLYVKAKAEGFSVKSLKTVVRFALKPQAREDWNNESPVIDKYAEVVFGLDEESEVVV